MNPTVLTLETSNITYVAYIIKYKQKV